MSMRFASMPPGGVAGDQPRLTVRRGNFISPSNSRRVSPSLQVSGRGYFSVCTSTPAARNGGVTPWAGPLLGGGAGDAAADFVSEAANIFLHGRRAEDEGQDFGG